MLVLVFVRAEPEWPLAVHDALLRFTVLPFPDKSADVVPDPSLRLYKAIAVPGNGCVFLPKNTLRAEPNTPNSLRGQPHHTK